MQAAFWAALAVSAVGFGWQPMPDGSEGVEYLIQVEPELLESLAEGESVPISGEVPEGIGPVRRVRLVVGSVELPRQAVTVLKPTTEKQVLPDGVVQTQYTLPPVQPNHTTQPYPQQTNPLTGALNQTGQQLQQYGQQAGQQASQAIQNAGNDLRSSADQFFNQQTQQLNNSMQRGINDAANTVTERFQRGANSFQQGAGSQQYNSAQGYAGQNPAGQNFGQPNLTNNQQRGVGQPSGIGQVPPLTGSDIVGSGEVRQRLDREIRPDEVGNWQSGSSSSRAVDSRGNVNDPGYRPTAAAGRDSAPAARWPTEANYDQYRNQNQNAQNAAVPNTGNQNSNAYSQYRNQPPPQNNGGTGGPTMVGNRPSGRSDVGGVNSPESPRYRTQPQNDGQRSETPQLTRAGVESGGVAGPDPITPGSERFRSSLSEEQRRAEASRQRADASDYGWDRERRQANREPLDDRDRTEVAKTGTPLFATIFAWVMLTGSVTGNIYLVWSYLDIRNKYRGLARRGSRFGGQRYAAA